jgi:hypothetical protein
MCPCSGICRGLSRAGVVTFNDGPHSQEKFRGSVMRRSFVYAVTLGILVGVLLPGLVLAQEFRGPLGPWDFMARLGVSASTGYFGHKDGVHISFAASGQPQGSVESLRQQFGLQGISTEMRFPVRLVGPLGFVFGGGYSGCFRSDAEETMQKAGSDPLKRTWRVQPQACNVHGAMTVDVLPSLLGLVGFRYENFQTKFFSPKSGFSTHLGTQDSANISYNAYVPCVGVILCAPSLFPGLNVRVGALGFPVLLGSVEYRESWNEKQGIGGTNVNGFMGSNPISRGAFVNAFGEVSLITLCGVEMGAYGKYEFMSGATPVYVGQGNSAIPTVVYDFDFQRRLWGVGGRVSLSF